MCWNFQCLATSLAQLLTSHPFHTDACLTWLPLTTYSYSYFPPQPFLLKMMGIYEYDEHCIQANKQMRKVIRLPEVVINISLMKSLVMEFSLYNTHTHTPKTVWICMHESVRIVCVFDSESYEWMAGQRQKPNEFNTHTHTHTQHVNVRDYFVPENNRCTRRLILSPCACCFICFVKHMMKHPLNIPSCLMF